MRNSLSVLLLSIAILSPSFSSRANVPDYEVVETSSPTPMRAYTYCFSVLPSIAKACNPLDKTHDILTHPETIDKLLTKENFKSPFTPDQITVNTIKHGAREIVVWTFPAPNEITLPLYVAFVPENDHYRYFTFEFSFDENFETGNSWVLGESDGGHRSYGQYPSVADWKEFAELVIAKFLK